MKPTCSDCEQSARFVAWEEGKKTCRLLCNTHADLIRNLGAPGMELPVAIHLTRLNLNWDDV